MLMDRLLQQSPTTIQTGENYINITKDLDICSSMGSTDPLVVRLGPRRSQMQIYVN
jgi:hypothetical protein